MLVKKPILLGGHIHAENDVAYQNIKCLNRSVQTGEVRMLITYRKLFIVVLLFIPSIFTFANQRCGVVNIASNNEFVLDLQQINNEAIYPSKTIKKILDGRYSINLLPGTHILNIGIVIKNEYKALWRKNSGVKQAKSLNVKLVQLNVKENTHYRLALSADNSTIVVNEKEIICPVTNGDNIFGQQREAYFDKELLPIKEEAQLNSIMYRLAGIYSKGAETQTVANVLPLKVDPYFGSVIDNVFSNNDTLKVLRVLPYSLAAHYGLRSGDEIIQLGDRKISKKDTGPRDVMNNYLLEAFKSRTQTVKYINMKVRRSGRVIDIGGEFHSNIIPQSHYYIGDFPQQIKVVNNQELTKQLNFEYDRFLLALQDYYQNKGITDQQVIVKRDRQPNKRIRFSGTEVIGRGININSVDENSALKTVGLMKGDLLVDLNNDGILIDQVNTLATRLSLLAEKEPFSLTVVRSNQVISLSGDYYASYTPSFTLNIDMASIDIGLQLIKDEKFGDPKLRGLHHQRNRGKRTTVKSVRSSHSRDIKN